MTPAPLSPLASALSFAVQTNDQSSSDDDKNVQEANDSNNVEVIPPVENPTYETLRYDRELVQEATVCSLADVTSHVANEQQQEIAIVSEEVVALEETEAVEVVAAAVVEEEEEDSIYGE